MIFGRDIVFSADLCYTKSLPPRGRWHGVAVYEIRSLSAVWNQHEVLNVIHPKEKYTLTRDNHAKRVGKLACKRTRADCSASVPSLTEHSTKCRRANGGRAKSMPCRRFATDSMHPAVRLHANPSDWIEKRPFENGLFS